MRNGVLYSREGWEISMNDVLAVPLVRAQLEAYKSVERKLQSLTDQPAPADFPDWVFEKMA
ncbi:MAG TPA: hypothetical protein VNH83_08735 [Bryobacteraceae bacterium]|nr:hypothetical protein [Bryobacteraceae bacterium]